MAKRKKAKPKRHPIRAIAVALVLLAVTLTLYVPASVTHLRRAEVTVKDLPQAFDGLTLLYLTDIDICGTNTVSDLKRTCAALDKLDCDIVLIGGDLVSPGLVDRLNGDAPDTKARIEVLDALKALSPNLGMFAVAGDNDGDASELSEAMRARGITLLDNTAMELTRGGGKLTVAGIGTAGSVVGLSQSVRHDDCVILISHTPDRLTEVRVNEAKDGGMWTDLILCGHTHGGQARLFGRNMLTLTERETQYLSGWYEGSVPILVSSGLGCESVNLRAGTESEIWLITLRCST